MADPNIVTFTGTRIVRVEGTYDKRTGQVDARLIDATELGVQGNLSDSEISRFSNELKRMTGIDTNAIRDRVANKAYLGNEVDDETEVEEDEKKVELKKKEEKPVDEKKPADEKTVDLNEVPPNRYTKQRRYSDAKTDAELREGFKGQSVKEMQQQLRDLGYDLTGGTEKGKRGPNKDGVDGYWGPNTEKAYRAYLADNPQKPVDTKDEKTKVTPRKQSIDAIRNDAKNRTKSEKIDNVDEASKELVQDVKSANVDDVNKRLTNTRNADMKELDKKLPRNEDGTYKTTYGEGGGVSEQLFGVDGNDADYADLTQRMLKGNRNEGDDAAGTSKVVDEYGKRLLEARTDPNSPISGWGTDENKINDVFATASGAQLAELDRRLKAGIKDADGNVVKYEKGLQGYIDDEIGDGAHKKLLLAQLNRALR